MSKLLETASKEANAGNKDIVNRVRHIGNKFLNSVELSSQEAVYLVLQMPLRRSTREFQIINTSNPDKRTFLLKTLDKIKELPDNSTDIESDNIIKRYQRRPRKLEELCLANFVAWFNCVNDKHSDDSNTSCNTTETSDDFLLETDLTDNVNDDPPAENNAIEDTTECKLKGGMKLVKKKTAKIIITVRFNKEKEPENYYREQLMLYTPWRNEQKDLIKDCQTYQERYQQVELIVNSNKEQYDRHSDILEKAIEDLNENDNTSDDPVSPNTQHINEQDAAAKTKPSELFGCFDPGTSKQHSQYDLFDDMGILPRHNDEEELVQNRLNDSDYRQLVRSLNIKQKEFFYHVLHSIKTKDDPLALFLSGGAGVGKSTVTNTLYEALMSHPIIANQSHCISILA